MNGPKSSTGSADRQQRGPSWTALSLLFGLAACGPQGAGPVEYQRRVDACSQSRPNIILVDIDSMRADRLPAGDAGPQNTPALKALSERGVVFTEAYSQSGWTLPAVLAMLTSRYPMLRRSEEYVMHLVRDDEQAFPKILSMYGYQNALLFGKDIWLAEPGSRFGFHTSSRLPDMLDDPAAQMASQVTEFVVQEAKEPFFLFIHQVDIGKWDGSKGTGKVKKGADSQPDGKPGGPPDPRTPPAPGGTKSAPSREQAIESYDAALAAYDGVVAALDQALQGTGLGDCTVLIITSPHGQDLGEHLPETGHCALFDSVLHIPLLIVDPKGQKGVQRDTVAQSIDIGPTILELADIPVQAQMEGRSLLPLVRSPVEPHDWPERPVLSVTNDLNLSLRTTGYKAILSDLPQGGAWPPPQDPNRTPSAWLFDLSSDPEEMNNIQGNAPAEALALLADLQAWRDKRLLEQQSASPVQMGDAVRKTLQDQGYWGLVGTEDGAKTPPHQGAAPPQAGKPPQGAPPPRP